LISKAIGKAIERKTPNCANRTARPPLFAEIRTT